MNWNRNTAVSGPGMLSKSPTALPQTSNKTRRAYVRDIIVRCLNRVPVRPMPAKTMIKGNCCWATVIPGMLNTIHGTISNGLTLTNGIKIDGIVFRLKRFDVSVSPLQVLRIVAFQ